MTAHPRPQAASDPHIIRAAQLAVEYWHRAEKIRREWLAHGLATAPADRAAVEASLTTIYARHSRPRPRFVWVDSPYKALPLLSDLPTHAALQQWIVGRRPPGNPPLASDIAAGLSRLRSALDASVAQPDVNPPRLARKRGERWPVLPPLESLELGIPLVEVLRTGVRAELWTRLAERFYLPIRAALGPVPVAWYGQQDSYWIAYYDVLQRLGLARYASADADQFEDWATLARSGGWWWPGEDTCVVVDRPAVIGTSGHPNMSSAGIGRAK